MLQIFTEIICYFFCETFLSLSASSSIVTRFKALAKSASPNVSQKLFKSSTIDKAA